MQSELRQHVADFAPDVRLESQLLRIYHRTLAQRLWEELTEPGSQARKELEDAPTCWLHPRAVWAARLIKTDPLLFADVQKMAYEDLQRSVSSPPELEILTNASAADPWCATVGRYLSEPSSAAPEGLTSLRLTGTSAEVLAGRVRKAMHVLHRAWPEAADEIELLLRSLIFFEGAEFSHGSFQYMLGSTYVNIKISESLVGTVEMLLHELGHQSLFLHNAFALFMENSSEMAEHALRDDPRPLGGTLHAAQALARMVIGFTRWCSLGGAPAEARVRREFLAAALRDTLQVLDAKAVWTADGERYYAGLVGEVRPLLGSA